MLSWVEEEVQTPFGPIATRYWAVPNTASLSDNNKEEDEDEAQRRAMLTPSEDQLGAVLWNSNHAALQHLRSAGIGRGWRVVELGAGVGCLGLALAQGGARVCITDIPPLLPLLQHNVALNRTRWRSPGRCVAFAWPWGPTESLNLRKKIKSLEEEETVVAATAAALRAARQPSRGMKSCQTALTGTSEEHEADPLHPSNRNKPKAEGQKTSRRRPRPTAYPEAEPSPDAAIDLVVLCDALYGNPRDWPNLIYTLSELLAQAPDNCRVLNFCEQRVDDVEGPFLRLLEEENNATVVEAGPESRTKADEDDAQAIARVLCKDCRLEDSSVDWERLNRAILAQATREKRLGVYRWAFHTFPNTAADEKSDLGMTVRLSEIRWTRDPVPAKRVRRESEDA